MVDASPQGYDPAPLPPGVVMVRVVLGILVASAVLVVLPRPVSASESTLGSIVKIETTYQRASYSQPWKMSSSSTRTGSGSILAGRRILTNAHVVSDQTFIQVRRAGSPNRYVAQLVAVSHEFDLALLTVPVDAFWEGAKPLEIGTLPAIGDSVTALGFPEGGTRITVTEGIVSRIDRTYYSHSYYENLACQIDAAINPGSSGGPVLAGGTIVGVAFQTGYGENVGWMVPAPVVRHFLRDLEDGRHDGAPVLPCSWQVMENVQLRAHYRMGPKQSGVMVTKIAPLFEGEGKLRAKDILLSIDGHDIANDGSIEVRAGERITFRYAIDRKHVGDELTLEVLRDGVVKTVVLELAAAKRDYGHLVPRIRYDERPRYYIVGGFVFSPLSSNYYETWNSWDDVPLTLKRYYYELRTKENEARKEIVVLIDFLPDALNVGYDFEDSIVAKVNGKSIHSLADLAEAFEQHEGPSHRIELENYDWEVVLDRRLLEERGPKILEKYGVPAARSEDL